MICMAITMFAETVVEEIKEVKEVRVKPETDFYLGMNFGFVSGFGFSARVFGPKLGMQMTYARLEISEDQDSDEMTSKGTNFGIEVLYSIHSSKNYRFYALLGGANYSLKGDYHFDIADVGDDDFDHETRYKIQTYGLGPGFEIKALGPIMLIAEMPVSYAEEDGDSRIFLGLNLGIMAKF